MALSLIMKEHLGLRPLDLEDALPLRQILASPEVSRWWHLPEDFPLRDDPEVVRWTVEVDGVIAGMVQFAEEPDPLYRHASIDIFLAPQFHGRGLGTEIVRRTADHLIGERGHHRITIDPARDNLAAIRAYEKAGFRPVGVLHAYERNADGEGWHDGLLMELVVLPETPPSALHRSDSEPS